MILLLYPRLLAAAGLDLEAMQGTQWYGLYFNDLKAGYAVHSLTVDDAGAVVATEDAVFNVNMGAIPQRMRIFTQRVYAAQGDLISINMRVEDPSGEKNFIAAVDDDIMMFRTVRGNERTEEILARPRESLADFLAQRQLVNGGSPAIGDEVTFSMFEPLYAQEITGTSRIDAIHQREIDGEMRTVFEVHTVLDLMQIDSIALVLENGVTYRDQIADIIEMRLETEEEATAEVPVPDVVTSNAALLDTPITDARTRESLVLRLRGPLTEDHLIEDGRQTFTPDGDSVRFVGTRRDLDSVVSVSLPVDEPTVAEWLEPSFYVQSNDQRLIDKAAEIIGDETDAFAAAKLLNAWVFANVRKTFSARLSEALEVLESLEGDCTEHSVLFVGLARAAGIPAREVAGLVYVDTPEPGFYFHQWAKVWVGEWVDMDPTFNQVAVDATHIKLAVGDLLEQAQLIPIIGKIEVEVVAEEDAVAATAE